MKKSKFILLLMSFVLVFSVFTPLTAFAYPDPARLDWVSISHDNADDESDPFYLTSDSKFLVAYHGYDDYLIVVLDDWDGTQKHAFFEDDNGQKQLRIFNWDHCTGILVNMANPYSGWELQSLSKYPFFLDQLVAASDDVYLNYETHGGLTKYFIYFGDDHPATSDQVFPSRDMSHGTHIPTNPNIQHNQISTSLGSLVESKILSQPLKELLAVLPVSLSVLITFLSIRKGIAFILGTLRTA